MRVLQMLSVEAGVTCFVHNAAAVMVLKVQFAVQILGAASDQALPAAGSVSCVPWHHAEPTH